MGTVKKKFIAPAELAPILTLQEGLARSGPRGSGFRK